MGNREQSPSLGLGPVSLVNHPENGPCPLCSFGAGTYSDTGKLRSDPRRHLGMGKQQFAHITPLLPALSPCRPFSSWIAGLQPPSRSSTARACRLSPTTLVSVPQPRSTRATSQGSSAWERVSGLSPGSSAAAGILFGEMGCADTASQPSAGAAAASLQADCGGRWKVQISGDENGENKCVLGRGRDGQRHQGWLPVL